jgi:SagB-type dehydrogenase family enzyme
MKDITTLRRFLKADRWAEWRELDTDQRKGLPPPPPQKPYPEDAKLFDLVLPADFTIGRMPVIEAIRRRRSRREYTDEPLTLEELSFLLWATQGHDPDATEAFRNWLASKGATAAAETTFTLRPVPSAGACHPFETYIVAQRVSGLASGLYRYLPMEHRLVALQSGSELTDRVTTAFMKWMHRSAAIFIWTTIPYRTEWRYSIVGHKMIAQESGHVCQNLYLACESIGAGACAIAAYDQAEVDALIGVGGDDEFTIYLAPVGKVTSADYHFDH